jgi:endonuclease/exonuclease/phosphatase (EEP) superfamily protein YafD
VTIYNIHLTPIATNQLRIRQINNTFGDLNLNNKNAIIIAGDFNYPYGRRRFEQEIHKYNLKEATNNLNFTMEKRILNRISVKLKLDYVLYKKLKCVSNEKLLIYRSDHFPVLSTFKI